MKGSEKQVSWATDIQARFASEAQSIYGRSEKFDRVLDHLLAIDEAVFWIDYRDYDLRTLCDSLHREGLRNKGLDFSNTIKLDKETFAITETWQVIIQDRKGGHKETRTKTW